jgi:hypothetical protein
VNSRGDKLRNVEAVVEKKIPDHKWNLKAKVNHKLDFAISSKIPVKYLEDIATVTKGFAVTNAGSKERSFSYGLQLDLNV